MREPTERIGKKTSSCQAVGQSSCRGQRYEVEVESEMTRLTSGISDRNPISIDRSSNTKKDKPQRGEHLLSPKMYESNDEDQTYRLRS
jgi:hypothetical protein